MSEQQDVIRPCVSISVAGGQIDGAREYQEDAFAIHPDLELTADTCCTLLILCDGMGGHAGGRIASALAIETFHACFTSSEAEVRDRLSEALQAANDAIRQRVEAESELEGMGTTLLCALVIGDLLHWISVGDSPMWLLREGTLRRLNEDHSMAPVLDRMVEMGELEAEDAAEDPKRNQLRSALIGAEIELVDLPERSIVLHAGDRLLLASDGIETLAGEEIESMLSSNSAADVGDGKSILLTAVEQAAKPHQDNTTVILADVKARVSGSVGSVLKKSILSIGSLLKPAGRR